IADVPTSSISGERIVPVPVIEANGNTFTDRLEVRIKANAANERLRFTTDGSEPNANSPIHDHAMVLADTTTVKAIEISDNGQRSLLTVAVFHKMPQDWIITLQSNYRAQYKAGAA